MGDRYDYLALVFRSLLFGEVSVNAVFFENIYSVFKMFFLSSIFIFET